MMEQGADVPICAIANYGFLGRDEANAPAAQSRNVYDGQRATSPGGVRTRERFASKVTVIASKRLSVALL